MNKDEPDGQFSGKSGIEEALSLVRDSLEGKTSKACYLLGSFGSGKSHFMAVLNLLLQQNATAREISELADAVTKHNSWTSGKKFMLVPFNLIGATLTTGGGVTTLTFRDPKVLQLPRSVGIPVLVQLT